MSGGVRQHIARGLNRFSSISSKNVHFFFNVISKFNIFYFVHISLVININVFHQILIKRSTQVCKFL